MIQLSQRLRSLADFVPSQARLADIGSDHAYLPIYSILNHHASYAIASEVAEGPFQHAVEEVKKQGLSHKIDVRFANGLQSLCLDDQVDCISIAGMGGHLIAEIIQDGLDRGLVHDRTLFILQPNNEEEFLRSFLVHHSFHIDQEYLMEENGHSYEMMTCYYLPDEEQDLWTAQELYMGKDMQASNPALFQSKWQKELQKIEEILENLSKSKKNQADKIKLFEEKKLWIKENI